MTRREPPDVAILAARIMRAWPALSPFSCASLADDLCSIERAQRRHAERCCSGADGGYVRRVGVAWLGTSRTGRASLEHDPEAEQRAGERIGRRIAAWRNRVADLHPPTRDAVPMLWVADCDIELQHDPRGPVLLLRLPQEGGMVPV